MCVSTFGLGKCLFVSKCIDSHEAVVSGVLDSIVILAHGLVDVVGVGSVAGETLLGSAGSTLIEDLLADTDILFHHLDAVDVVDLNEMSGETVVKEVRREHHTVASVPELGLILLVEVEDFSGASESESAEDHVGGKEPDKETRVVKGSVLQANVAREDLSLHAKGLVDHQPPVVHEAHHAAKTVLSVLALAHLEGAEDAADGATALSKTLVHQVLHTAGTAQHPVLESLSHCFCL